MATIEKLELVIPEFSWQTPIEEELLRWTRYMKNSNRTYIIQTMWGRKQKREAEIYARAFEMMEKRIINEMNIRVKE